MRHPGTAPKLVCFPRVSTLCSQLSPFGTINWALPPKIKKHGNTTCLSAKAPAAPELGQQVAYACCQLSSLQADLQNDLTSICLRYSESSSTPNYQLTQLVGFKGTMPIYKKDLFFNLLQLQYGPQEEYALFYYGCLNMDLISKVSPFILLHCRVYAYLSQTSCLLPSLSTSTLCVHFCYKAVAGGIYHTAGAT